ncbi:phytyl ester synthase 1, chloroplastic-like [Bidens hawaiensis]|uniref:phytyl ester synthase 1, chloroplastic-like n=1 Tax=Bidens hawaiensis TaxID=980011 RepID=UPI00404A0B40
MMWSSVWVLSRSVRQWWWVAAAVMVLVVVSAEGGGQGKWSARGGGDWLVVAVDITEIRKMGLIQIVEDMVMIEHTLSPNKPTYLLGESFGGALALAMAAWNPTVDLILILANPATSYERSPLHVLPSLLGYLPEEYYEMLPYAMSRLIGDYIKIAMVRSYGRDHLESLWQLFAGFGKDLRLLSDCGRDNLLPSKEEAQRLFRSLKHCDVRVFEENGHTILLESGVNVLTAIKTTSMYRRSSKHDILKNFLPITSIPCMRHGTTYTLMHGSPELCMDILLQKGGEEWKSVASRTHLVNHWWYRLYIDAVMFSTMEDGKIVRGLAGIPDEGPVLIVGNHMLMGIDVFSLVMEFLREENHPSWEGVQGEVAEQQFHIPIRCDVEKNIAYLLKKREEDPYRGTFERYMWQMKNG